MNAADDTELAVLRERAARLAAPEALQTASGLELVVFTIAGERYALPAAALREVMVLTQRVPLPGAMPPVVALTLWRGSLLRLVDIRAMLDLLPTALNDLTRVLVIEGTTTRLGLLVDDVLEIRSIETGGLEAPRSGTVRRTELIVGVTADAVAVLSAEHLLALAS